MSANDARGVQITDPDYRPDKFSLSNSEVIATGTLAQGAVLNIAREVVALRKENRLLEKRCEALDGNAIKIWWHERARPIIDAIGEISVQEAMDAIERDL